MKQIIRSNERYFQSYGNIQSYFLFSFANYHDPKNMSWGQLRVFNDDFIGTGVGFPMHPHSHFEIITVMLSGTITHKDSLGNIEKIAKDEIQVTNTGSGIFHSEFNEDAEDIQLYQIWFSPKKSEPKPIYYTTRYKEEDVYNTLYTLASGIEDCSHKLVSDVSLKRGIFEAGKKLEVDVSNFCFLYITFGKVSISGEILESRDQMRIQDEGILTVEFLEKTDFIFIKTL